MSDPCKNCTARGYYQECIASPCFHHEAWIDKQRIEKIKRLEKLIADIWDVIGDTLDDKENRVECLLLEAEAAP